MNQKAHYSNIPQDKDIFNEKIHYLVSSTAVRSEEMNARVQPRSQLLKPNQKNADIGKKKEKKTTSEQQTFYWYSMTAYLLTY